MYLNKITLFVWEIKMFFFLSSNSIRRTFFFPHQEQIFLYSAFPISNFDCVHIFLLNLSEITYFFFLHIFFYGNANKIIKNNVRDTLLMY